MGSDQWYTEAVTWCAISIHPPREGSDSLPLMGLPCSPNFYPRAPRGERPAAAGEQLTPEGFLSTLPARGSDRVAC